MKESVLTVGASVVAALLVAWASMGTALAAGGAEAGGFEADDIWKPVAIVAAILVAGGAAYMANRRRRRVRA